MPPSIPPARLLRRVMRPSSPTTISSCAWEPGRIASRKPSPISTPLMAWTPMTALANAASSLRSDSTYVPIPAGTPYTTTSITPPKVSAFSLASSMRAIICCSAVLSNVRTGEASNASRSSGFGSTAFCGSVMPAPPIDSTWETVRMPNVCSRNCLATSPKATRDAVSRALERSSTGRASSKPYLRMPVRSACPGRGRDSGALRPSRGMSWSSGSALITSVHFGHSVLAISMATGEPMVSPKRTPVSMRTLSCSNFMRAPRPYPRRRRANAPTISSVVTWMPAGSPSIMATSASPCDSPAVCQRNMPTLLFCQIRFVDYLNGMWYMICLPSLLCGMAVSVEDIRARRIPRMWIAVGCLAQVIVDITYALSVNSLFLALQALLFAALSAVLQCALALIKPGALGFGDVTTTLLIGLAVGMFGLFPVVFWWFAISVLGLLWLAIWTRSDPQKHTRFAGKTPFAPTIVVAGAISIAMHALC